MADTQEEIQKRDDQIRDTIMSKLVGLIYVYICVYL